jgi:hypothetical protein
MSDWTAVKGINAASFNDTYPALAAVQVAGLPKGAKVEIEMVAKKRLIDPVKKRLRKNTRLISLLSGSRSGHPAYW